MGTIRLGNGPDFCMWRGLEIVNYRLIFFVKSKDEVFRKRIITDRSLAMISRRSKAFLKVIKICDLKKMDLENFNQSLDLKIENNEHEVILQLCLPDDLSEAQLSIITEVFRISVFS